MLPAFTDDEELVNVGSGTKLFLMDLWVSDLIKRNVMGQVLDRDRVRNSGGSS